MPRTYGLRRGFCEGLLGLVLVAPKIRPAQLVRHTPFGHHKCRHTVTLAKPSLAPVVTVCHGSPAGRHCAKTLASGDGHFEKRVCPLGNPSIGSVPGLVVGGHLLLLRVEHNMFALQPTDHTLDGLLQVG